MEGNFRPGQLVKSLAGRDAGRHFLVIRLAGDRGVLVADGDIRKVARPKLKNCRHLHPYPLADEVAARKLDGGGNLSDGEIKAVLASLLEKGGRESG